MSLSVVDFHVHYLGPQWRLPFPEKPAASGRSRINDLEDVLKSANDVAVRVLVAPPAFPRVGDEPLASQTISAINDHLASVVAGGGGRLAGLATIDLWQASAAVEEIARVRELGLSGIVVDAAADDGDKLLDDPAVVPALEAAAEHGLTVFVHPVFPRGFTDQVRRLGHPGILLARGAVTAASLVALLIVAAQEERRLPTLVTPSLAAPVISAAHYAGVGLGTLHFDTMGFHPGTIRYLLEHVGAERLVVGSDSPIVADSLKVSQVEDALTAAGLDGAQAAAVAGGNARRLLGLPAAVPQ